MKNDVLAGVSITVVLCAMAFAYVQLSSSAAPRARVEAAALNTADAVTLAVQPSGDAGVAAPAASAAPMLPAVRQDPLSIEERTRTRVAELDGQLRAEPYSPNWAESRKAEIDRALSKDALADFAGPAPEALEVSCRSATCRISMKFDDGIAAGNTLTALTAGIAEYLPHAVIMSVPGGVQGVEYHVFAATRPASASPASPYPG